MTKFKRIRQQLGYGEGTCSRCGRVLTRKRPINVAICDCYKYCPTDHGTGVFSTPLVEYTPDLYPPTYGPIVAEDSENWGDLAHPQDIRYYCTICRYHSAQLPIEVAVE